MSHPSGINGVNGEHQTNGRPAQHRPRLPTIERALQCSPFLSILPLSQEMVAVPEARPPGLPSTPYAPGEENQVKSLLRNLDAEARQTSRPPLRLSQITRDLHALIHGGSEMTRYNFKTSPLARRPQSSSRNAPQTPAGQATSQGQGSNLGGFAEAFLRTSEISHGYLQAVDRPVNTLLRDEPPAKSPSTAPGQTDKGARQNGSPYLARLQPQATSALVMTPAVIIPVLTPTPSPAKTVNLQGGNVVVAHIPKQSATPSPIKKRKREINGDSNKRDEVALDHREHADAAVQNLNEVMFNVLEAEDQLEPDTSGTMSRHAEEFFLPGLEGSNSYILRPEVHNNLEDAITKAANVKRIGEVSLGSLLRIQKLCAASFIQMHDLDIGIPSSADDDVAEQWSSNIRAAENSLRASKILLKLMTSGRDEKQLQPDEMIQNLLENTRYILDKCLIPVIETRASTDDTEFWTNHKERIALLTTLLSRAGRVLKLLGDIVVKIELSEAAINGIEFLASSLVFVENAPAEKDSLLGLQKVENVRRHAMDLLAKTFLRYPDQRTFILDDILSQLEKLPVTRQSARQYKVLDGKPIQLVSALIMQLVQASAIRVISEKSKRRPDEESVDTAMVNGSDEDSDELGHKTANHKPSDSRTDANSNEDAGSLADIATPLFSGATDAAFYVAKYLVQRALTSSKTGDQPYRNLLDIFTEDFLGVLGSPDWPASELMLRALLSTFVNITNDEKNSAPAKNMALDLMALMGAGIADLQAHVQQALPTLEVGTGALKKMLLESIEDTVAGGLRDAQLLDLNGPYPVVVAYYQDGDAASLQSQSAQSQFLAQWAKNLLVLDKASDEEKVVDKELDLASQQLRDWILEPGNVQSASILPDASAQEVRLAYAVVMLNLPFCRGLARIFSILLRSLSSTQATLRSKAIKSVVQLLEKDPAILERSGNVLSHIVNSTSDSSPMVRDAALGLIGKCMGLKPSLEAEGCKTLIARTLDPAINVRKRALRLLRDLYPRTKNREVKIAIADAILRRVTDIEETVNELARQMIEEMWFYPYHSSTSKELSAQAKNNLQQHAYHIVATTMRSSDSLNVFETLVTDSLVATNKTAETNKAVCKALVVSLFDGIIDNDAAHGTPPQAELLQTMTAFAKAEAHLFTAEQMTLLRPYIQNLATNEDLLVYRAVIVIYRHVLPVLPPLRHSFLSDVQTVLCQSVTKLGKAELCEITACLWIIDGVLKNTDRLFNLVRSVFVNLLKLKHKDLVPGSQACGQAKRLLMIAGNFGKVCDFQAFRSAFQEQLPKSKSESVSGMMIDFITPFASPELDVSVRCEALEAICLICQASPKNFLKASVTTTFSIAFQDNDPKLALAIVTGVRDFYVAEEERSKSRAESQANGDRTGTDRLAKSMVLSDHDGAATSIAQHFLPRIIRLALSSVDELALACAEVMASTDRQGLVHPKETGPALVALETSPNTLIAKLAYTEHQALHSKHESVLEPEYVKAVEQAFIYQKDTVKSVSGLDANQQPKLRLFFDVLKSGSAALRRKLLGKLCTRSLLDVNKTESVEYTISHLQSVCFTLQNLSTLEYSRIDEITSMVSAIEKAFSTTGNAVSQRIEASLVVQSAEATEETISAPPPPTTVDHNLLRHLAACSTVLTLLWETRTFLRKAWGLQSLRLNGKAKAQARDTSKAPNKATNYPTLVKDHLAQLLITMTSLNSPEAMTSRCHSFVEMLAVDSDLNVASDEDENGQPRYKTPEDDEQEAEVGTPASNGVPGSGRGRKRKAVSIGGTPRKPRLTKKPSMNRKGSRASSRSRGLEDDDDG